MSPAADRDRNRPSTVGDFIEDVNKPEHFTWRDFGLIAVCLAFVVGVAAGIVIAVAYVSHLIFG